MNLSQPIVNEAHALKCELAGEVLRSSGRLRLRVTGWSMVPAIWPGDTLIVDRLTSAAVSEGDIVLFGRDRRLFAHRVVAKTTGSEDTKVLTQGDAMPQCDPPVENQELLGKVSYIMRNRRCIEPHRTLRVGERAIAALVRRSEIAARIAVGVHGLRQSSQVDAKQNHV